MNIHPPINALATALVKYLAYHISIIYTPYLQKRYVVRKELETVKHEKNKVILRMKKMVVS